MDAKEIIVLGGGCFWCTEAIFKNLRGVLSVKPGYAGGVKENPTYEEVCSGKTGQAEVIKIDFRPEEISLNDILTVFFATHDPTTPNRQGDDIGPQYRSIILYGNLRQKEEVEEFVKRLNRESSEGEKIVTEIRPLEKFYEAEDYHRDYYRRNAGAPYCQVVINPKLKKVQQEFARLLQKS